MTNRCRIIFHPQDLVRLINHLTDGALPLDAEVLDFLIHPRLERVLAFHLRSSRFDTHLPLQFRYRDKSVYTLQPGEEGSWEPANDE